MADHWQGSQDATFASNGAHHEPSVGFMLRRGIFDWNNHASLEAMHAREVPCACSTQRLLKRLCGLVLRVEGVD